MLKTDPGRNQEASFYLKNILQIECILKYAKLVPGAGVEPARKSPSDGF